MSTEEQVMVSKKDGVPLLDQPHLCAFCNKKFMKEQTLFTHMCEQKRRAFQKDEKRVQTGFLVFNRFFHLTQMNHKNKTYDEFCRSPYYNAFVKFGSYVTNMKPLYPEKFVDFVIKSGVKLDHWTRDELYEKYLKDMIKVEPIDTALSRSVNTMVEWASEKNAQFNHYFIYASPNRVVNDIRNGRISPWLLMNCQSGKDLLMQLNDEQLVFVSNIIDFLYWTKRFKENPKDVDVVKELCAQAGIK